VSLSVGGCKISVCMTVYNNGRPGNLSFLARLDSILQMMGTRKQNFHLLIEIAGTTIFFDSFFNRQAIVPSDLLSFQGHKSAYRTFRHSIFPPPAPPPCPNPLLKPRLTRRRLRPPLQVRVRVTDRPGNSIESEPRRLGRELHFGADVEEGEVAVDQMMGNTRRFILKQERKVSRQQDFTSTTLECTRKRNGKYVRRRRSGRRGHILPLQRRSGPTVWGRLRLCRSLKSRRRVRRFWCGSSGSRR
jgi:hypothetical protein